MKQTRNFLAVAIVVNFGGNCNEKIIWPAVKLWGGSVAMRRANGNFGSKVHQLGTRLPFDLLEL